MKELNYFAKKQHHVSNSTLSGLALYRWDLMETGMQLPPG